MFYDRKTRHFNVEFYLHSERDLDVQNYLIFLLKKLGLNPILFKDKRFKCNRIRVNSKKFYNFLLKRCKKEIHNKEYEIGFISGLIDSEGDVRNSSIRIKNTNKQLMNKVRKFLSNIGLYANISCFKWRKKRWSNIYSISIPIKFINIDNNSIKIKRIKHSR
ncbi:MAG: LAGLIDADG family homing endonuclease [Candidatus Aenigmatarchaeota archaeon]